MSFREFLQKLNLASFHDALFEVTGLEVLEDYVKHVEEEDLEGLLEPAHGMRKPQLRKLWSALLELRQQMKATAAPAHAPRSQERDKGGDHGAAEGSPPSGQRREAASRPSAGTPTASRPTPAEGRSASGDRGGAAAAPPAGAAQGSAAAAEGSGGWGWGDASRRARADLAEIQKRKAEAVSSRERGSSSPSRTEAATAARPAKAAKKTKAQRPGGQAGQDPKERLQMEKAVLVLEDLIGKEEVKRAGLASRSPGDVGKRFTDLSMLYKRLKRTPLSNDFGPKPYRALAARYVCPPPASRDRPLGVQPEKKPVGIALEVTADELERRHQRRLRFDAYLQRRGVPTVLDASGPERLKGLIEEGSAKSRAQDARPPQPAAGKEQAADDDDDDWGDWTAPAPAIPVSRSLQQARREEPDSRTAEARTTSSEAPASAAPTSKEPCAGSEAESDPYLCLEEGEADSDSDSSVPDVEEAYQLASRPKEEIKERQARGEAEEQQFAAGQPASKAPTVPGRPDTRAPGSESRSSGTEEPPPADLRDGPTGGFPLVKARDNLGNEYTTAPALPVEERPPRNPLGARAEGVYAPRQPHPPRYLRGDSDVARDYLFQNNPGVRFVGHLLVADVAYKQFCKKYQVGICDQQCRRADLHLCAVCAGQHGAWACSERVHNARERAQQRALPAARPRAG